MGILNKIGDMIFGPEEYSDDMEEIAEHMAELGFGM